MRRIEIEIDGQVGVAELLEKNAPKTAEAVWKSLPITTTLSATKWSGRACAFQVPAEALAGVEGLEHPVCSIYPGTLVVRPDRREAILAYGASEYRSEIGVEYATRVARLVENTPAILARMSQMHDRGDVRITLRRASN